MPESVPQPAPEHPDPVSFQVTPLFPVSPPSCALNVRVFAEPTSTEFPVAGGTISIVIGFELPPPQPQKTMRPAQARKQSATRTLFMRLPEFLSSGLLPLRGLTQPRHTAAHSLIACGIAFRRAPPEPEASCALPGAIAEQVE